MTTHDTRFHSTTLSNITSEVESMGYEIVDLTGFFDLVGTNAKQQKKVLAELKSSARRFEGATKTVRDTARVLLDASEQSRKSVAETVTRVRTSSETAKTVASWVSDLSHRTVDVTETLKAVKDNNQQIVSIARHVNTLAINAKIEAFRAGDAGLGFSVVADAINDLSQKTSTAAKEISGNIEHLTDWIIELSQASKDVSAQATTILENSELNDTSLAEMEQSIFSSHGSSERISQEAVTMRQALRGLVPNLTNIDTAISQTTDGIEKAHTRLNRLVDSSESVFQGVTSMGGTGPDSKFIRLIQKLAVKISTVFETALKDRLISLDALFDQRYLEISNTDPVQKTTQFCNLTDRLLPPIQEPILDLDPRIVFCAAVDRNGYLPTHNLKFSRPQSRDPIWNTAHCRNRRVFDDRVGLKAGRNTAPFLCQVYRRDMGGGEFAMMKDFSAPIVVMGNHWGGVRCGVKF